jgi:glycosyltransferase involved in cell wall biosynthesis
VSEQGVYLREQYLAIGRMSLPTVVRCFLGRLTRAVVGVAYEFADQISPSSQQHAQWQQWLGAEPLRIRTIAHGADPLRFRAGARVEPPPTVVCVGRFTPVQGQADLIEAAALVRRSIPNVRFRFFGDGEAAYEEQCRELVRGLGLEQTVVLEGFSSEIPAALQDAHAYAFAGVSDGCSQSVIEAMLAELPIVTTSVGGIADIVGETALLVPPRDPVAMAESIGTLLRSPDSSRCLGEHARKRALHLFTQDRMIDAYRASYGKLAARPSEERLAPNVRRFAVIKRDDAAASSAA